MKLHISLALSTILVTTLNANNDYDLMSTLTLEELMDIPISTSTGTAKPLSLAPSIATVITDRDIAHSSARTLNEILEKVPGLHLYPSSAQYQTLQYDIRGIHTKYNPQIMILMNGTSTQTLKIAAPNTHLDLPLSAVKRIEIVRGPGSVLYGANAYSGVINIITKDAEYFSGSIESGIRYGSFNSGEVWLNHGDIKDNFSYSFNLSASSSDGDDGRIFQTDFQKILDTALPFGTSASLSPGTINSEFKKYNFNLFIERKNLKINIWANAIRDGGTGTGIANALDPKGTFSNERIHADTYYTQKLNDEIKLEHKLALSYNKTKSFLHIFPAGTTLPIGTDGNFGGQPVGGVVTFSDGYIGTPGDIEKTISYKSTLLTNRYENHMVRISGGFSFGKFEAIENKNFGPDVINGTEGIVNGTLTNGRGLNNTIYMPDVNRKVFFISVQDEWQFSPNWELTTGVRYDYFSDTDYTVNPRLALVWQTSNTLTTKLLYGSAFRAPSLIELYVKNNPVGIGNIDVEPEKIDTLELAFDYYPTDKLRGVIDFYYYKAKDLIDAKGVSLDNVGEQTGYGVELEVNYQPIKELTLKADYAYRYTKDETTNQEVTDAPKNLAHAELDWSFSRDLYTNVELFWIADMKRAIGDTREKIDNYSITNASISYRTKNNITLNISARNIFDKKIYEPSPSQGALGELDDYQMQGRYAFMEVKYIF